MANKRKDDPSRRKDAPQDKPKTNGNAGAHSSLPEPPLDLASGSHGLTTDGMKYAYEVNLKYSMAKDQYSATEYDAFMAAAYAVRDRMIDRWISTQQRYHKQNLKRVYYLSMEFLIGKLLMSSILNLGIKGQTKEALQQMGVKLEDMADLEYDAGLGNGGLGRLAACFLDSMATLGIPANGYGIMYNYGIFHQKIVNGHQVEVPDEWLRLGTPWAIERPEYTIRVRLGGRTHHTADNHGKLKVDWVDTNDVLAVPFDFPVPGYRNDVVNTLRLWSAHGTEEFDLEFFNTGDYIKAYDQKIQSENISKVLYPSDKVTAGMELRLKQEYFFSAASLADIMRRFKVHNQDLRDLPKKVAIQLNDTHPSLAIPEFMRLLVDEEGMEWDDAWEATVATFAYTNHTLLPEALETWSVPLLQRLLPRHLEIIYEINARFLRKVADMYPGDTDRLGRMSIIQEGDPKRVRMAYLCVVGSHSVNGVSALHSDLLKTTLLHDFHEIWPERFNNKTNGVTPRRWLLESNPRLSELITKSIGDKWVTHLDELKKLEKSAGDAWFRKAWREVKLANKQELSAYIKHKHGVSLDPNSLFDVQVKRIHEYKRQMLFGLFMVHQYLRLKHEPNKDWVPRSAIFGGKAAPSYTMAKLIIKFINSVAGVVGGDKTVRNRLQAIFLPDYRVSLAQMIFPASELSEQISLASTEASGTGNMKFMLNGALTIGTLDGANVEIAEEVGNDHIFLFGLKTPEVLELKRNGYRPKEFIDKSPALQEIFKLIATDFFSPQESGVFKPLVDSLMYHDPFMVMADFDDYVRAQDEAAARYKNPDAWTRSSIVNTARSGRFSSDRTIAEYAKDIWKV